MSAYIALMTIAGLGLLFLGTYSALAPTPVRARLAKFTGEVKTLEEMELEQPFSERIIRPIITQISRIMNRLMASRKADPTKDTAVDAISKRLLLAGNPGNLTAPEFIGIVALSTVALGFAFYWTAVLLGSVGPVMAMLVGLIGLLLGYLLPTYWLAAKISGRQREILRALPDTIDLLVVSLNAGIGFDIALQRITEKSDNALVREFRRMLAELNIGRPRRDALKDVALRANVPDLNTFIAAVIQADQLGVSISRVVAVQAEQIRVSRRQRIEETAAKAPLKMLFPMVFLIFPAMFIVILGPSVPRIFGGLF